MRTPAVLILLSLGFLPAPGAADVYQWQDANGNTIYSDQPPRHLKSAVSKPATRTVRLRSQRDQENMRLLPDRERRLLAAMAEHRKALQELRTADCSSRTTSGLPLAPDGQKSAAENCQALPGRGATGP